MSDARIREVRAGRSIVVEAIGFPAAQTPNLRLVLLSDDSVAIASSGAGISEHSAGNYDKTLDIPSGLAPGDYAAEWQFSGVWYTDEDIIRVTTALGDLISVSELGDYLGRDLSSDNGAVLAVDAAGAVCRTIAEQTFSEATDTITLDGTGSDALLLPELPVSNAGTVTVNGGTVTDYVLKGDGTLLRKVTDPTSIDWWTADWAYLPSPKWPAGRQNVEVTYDHGYPDADLPRDVRMVALSIASRLVVQGVAAQEQQGDLMVRYAVNATDLTNGEAAILRKYRR